MDTIIQDSKVQVREFWSTCDREFKKTGKWPKQPIPGQRKHREGKKPVKWPDTPEARRRVSFLAAMLVFWTQADNINSMSASTSPVCVRLFPSCVASWKRNA